ncbi:hypothetical protein DFH08DRAFT_888828 [Mycena albidolilacea]|uniref:Uncharacterized protein n=1 Tax=Mycena albidolilacea TaxID=1033008 RepID=A0AAD7EHQ1_9AGAR|nr:hypothetical protein DFH08DRAFT_888828 [Mycena albidolilacea]
MPSPLAAFAFLRGIRRLSGATRRLSGTTRVGNNFGISRTMVSTTKRRLAHILDTLAPQGGCVNTRPHLHLHRRRPHLLFPYAVQCMQPRSLDSAPMSQSIASHRSSPRTAQPYDCRAIPMRFPTTHGVRGGAPTPRCGSATCARGGLAP